MMRLRQKTEEQIEQDLLPFGFIDDGGDDAVEDDGYGFARESWQI
jgi:hypothetical protein